MPSKMRSLFKRKNKKNATTGPLKDVNGPTANYEHDRTTAPNEPADGSTASHDSNDIYLSKNEQQWPDPPEHSKSQSLTKSWSANHNNNTAVDEQDAAMIASQFVASSDEELNQKRTSQPDHSPFANSRVSNLNIRSHQGRDCDTKSRDGVPIITSAGADHFSPSAVRSGGNYATEGFYSKSKQVFGGKARPKTRPSAKTSAFGGAPRYDWMDIETTAAIKIQATYRRLQTQNYLDANGLSTPGMRNRRARLQAHYHASQKRNGNHMSSVDVPFPFSLCGVGLLFGDGTQEDDHIVQKLEKRKKEKKKFKVHRQDEEKRKFRMRKKDSQHLEEGIEVVESFDGEEHTDEEEEIVEQSRTQRSGRGSRKNSRNMSKGKSKGKSKMASKSQNDLDSSVEEGVFL